MVERELGADAIPPTADVEAHAGELGRGAGAVASNTISARASSPRPTAPRAVGADVHIG